MAPSIQYASFLIRLWREESAGLDKRPVDWKGEVEHIQTGERWNFSSLDELVAFLRQEAGDGGTGRMVLNQR